MKFWVNSTALRAKVIATGLPAYLSARQCKISQSAFGVLLKRDKTVTVDTADKLKRYFGDDVIRMEKEVIT